MISSYSFLDFSHDNRVSVVTVDQTIKTSTCLGQNRCLSHGLTFDRFILDRSYVALLKKYNNEHLKMLIKLIKVSRWYTSLVHSADLKMGLYDRSDRPDKHFPLPIGIVVTNIG